MTILRLWISELLYHNVAAVTHLSAARLREKAHRFQEVSRGFDSLSIRIVQPIDVESVESRHFRDGW